MSLTFVGANPTVKELETIEDNYTSLEELFQKTLEEYEQRCAKLSKLADEAKAQQDIITLTFYAIWTESSSRMACC